MEVYIRKCLTSLKGSELFQFLHVIDRDLPWQHFFKANGDDLFAILFKLTTYNQQYVLTNTKLVTDQVPDTFGGLKPTFEQTVDEGSNESAKTNFLINNLLLK